MEHILRKLFIKTDLVNSFKNFKSTKSIFHSLRRTEVTVMSGEENKTHNDRLSLIDNNAILRKKLKLIFPEDSEDVGYLQIQNNNNFILKTKEKRNKLVSNEYYLRANDTVLPTLKNEINNGGAKDEYIHEIIDIKCTQKPQEEKKVDNELKYGNEMIVEDRNEFHAKSPNAVTFTDDLKNDLQSLLMMMTISNKSSDSEERNQKIQKYESTQKKDVHVKKQVDNVQTVKEMNSSYAISNLLKIDALRIKTGGRNILRKYATKWMEYVKKQREKNIHCQRLASVNKFIDRLEKKKDSMNIYVPASNRAKQQARDYNTYQHRYKVQKHIIAIQKAKLEEQNRLIEELKYNKIVEASRQSLDHIKEDVKQTYYELDKHLKPKIKCLTNELKIRNIEENSLILHCLKVPQFLQRMEARAREREEKHAIIRERRKQMEEERIRLKRQAEIAKAEMDKEEKLKRIKELREKRKREKIENIRKKQHAERFRALIVMADLHYEKSLMAKYGIRPLKILVEMKRDSIEKAKAHYQFQLKKNLFLHWMWHTEDIWYERQYKAEDFSRKKLLRKAFDCLKKSHNEYVTKLQVAQDYYDFYVTKFVFKHFQEALLIIKKEYDNKWNNAVIYYNSNLLFKTLTCWRTLPALNALKREQDARKQKWREKVLQVVPDYVPPEE